MLQLLQQLAARLAQFRDEPALATDSADDGVTAMQRAAAAGQQLRELAEHIEALSERWSAVRGNTARLKLDESGVV